VKATLSLPRRATYADYLAADQDSPTRHEFLDGVIVSMAGGTHEHNAIASRFAAVFSARTPRGCRSYTPDQRFWIAASVRGTPTGRSSAGSRSRRAMIRRRPSIPW
jgi:Uma2 family endonuclease